MPSGSPQGSKSLASSFGGIFDSPYPIFVAVTAIAVGFIFFHFSQRKRNGFQEKGISNQDEHSSDIPVPLEDKDALNKEGGELGNLTESPAIHRSTRDEDDHGALVAPERRPIDGEEMNVQSRETERVDPDSEKISGSGEESTQVNRDEHNTGGSESMSSQASTTLQPQFVEPSSGDALSGGCGAPSDRNPINISPVPATVDGSTSKAQNKEHHSASIQAQTPPVSLKHPADDRGSNIVQRGETPSTTFFQGSSNVQINSSSFYDVRGNATIIRFGESQFTEDQRSFICDYIATFGNLPEMNDNLSRKFLTQFILNLPRVEAVFNDYQTQKKSGPCFEGTRLALLREMAAWVTEPDKLGMYILSGLAGIGKSTVAYTIALRAANLNLLGASFFFSRDEAGRRNAKRFFSTIAYQLCVYDEKFSKAIGEILETERGFDAISKGPQEQLQVLILEPLQHIVQARARPILIVVDALDECDEDDACSVLIALSRLVQELPSFKVILTTRPEPYFDPVLNSEACQSDHQIFYLHNIEDKVVNGDIRLYLQHSLSLKEVQRRYPRRKWGASEEDIDTLVHAAGRLFIIASTTVRYILDRSAANPAAQMQKLLRSFAQDRTPFKNLDHFYNVILRNIIPEDYNEEDIVSRYQSVVGAIISVQRPIPVPTLTHLVDIDTEDIRAVLDNLQSVILLDSDDDDVPRIYHNSFPDYLMDPVRCKEPRLRIDPRTSHIQIATHCFEIMDKHLKYNILGLGNFARFMSNEDALKADGITDEQLEEKIPPQLRYACVYWADHVGVAKLEGNILMNGLEKFADEHVLHCLEVLSLIGQLDSAHRIRATLKLLAPMSDLHQLLSDALHFVSKFHVIIQESALHTYYSALPFTPTESLLYHRYNKEAVHKICSIEGVPEKWDALVSNQSHGEIVKTIKFSLDGAHFVSWSATGEYEEDDMRISSQAKLKIWDAMTGAPISTIEGRTFAIAKDFSTVASSTDKTTIALFNKIGNAKGTTFTAPSKIETLAFSSESSRVAARLSDGTVCLWESRTSKLIGRIGASEGTFGGSKESFDGAENGSGGSEDGLDGSEDDWEDESDSDNDSDGSDDTEYELEFSSTGTRLAYSLPDDDIIKLCDGISGKLIADLQCGSYPSFAFSSDGSRIASVSVDCDLKLWNSESGELLGAVTDVDCDGQMAISTNGTLLATIDDNDSDDDEDDVVRLWNENEGSLSQIKALELDSASSVAFSSDNVLAIALAFNVKLYDVNSHSFVSTLPFRGFPTVLAFSPDSSHLAVGDVNGDVTLWDVLVIDTSRVIDTPSSPSPEQPSDEDTPEAHNLIVSALALSRDCARLACGLVGGAVELWETSPAKRRIASHQAHEGFIRSVGFSPDGSLFASGSEDEVIKVWNGEDGSLRGTLEPSSEVLGVALSNNMLVAGCNDSEVTLWSLETLSLIHTFKISSDAASRVSITDSDALIAVVGEDSKSSNLRALGDVLGGTLGNRFGQSVVSVLDVVNRTTIATFDVPHEIDTIMFLNDNSQLMVQTRQGVFLLLNLINKEITQELAPEHLVQHPNVPSWHGVPVWHCQNKERHYISALFSGHKSPVPVLWIPRDLRVSQWAQRLSTIALGCVDGRILLLRPPTSQDG